MWWLLCCKLEVGKSGRGRGRKIAKQYVDITYGWSLMVPSLAAPSSSVRNNQSKASNLPSLSGSQAVRRARFHLCEPTNSAAAVGAPDKETSPAPDHCTQYGLYGMG